MGETVHEQQPSVASRQADRSRLPYGRLVPLVATSLAVVTLAACTASDGPATPARPITEAAAEPFNSVTTSASPEQAAAERLVQQAAASLLALGQSSHNGLRFRSQIQSPNFQTDRDVGAAGVGVELIALARRYPGDGRFVQAAEQTATWLLAVSHQDGDMRWWSDYVNDNGESHSRYTSFDDGTIGIGDFFWRLYDLTHDEQYKTAAVQSVRWTFAQAQPFSGGGYHWRWDTADHESPYFMGQGQGVAGLVQTFATFYERTKDSDPAFAAECRRYTEGALHYMDVVRQTLGGNGGDARALPETGVIGQDGDTSMDSGYLSGAAGAASMYLKLYQVFNDEQYLRKADELLGWLDNTTNGPKVRMGDSAAWKLMLDPKGGDDLQYATGVEEGAAGIGRTFLEAYRATQRVEYRQVAQQAGNWLLSVAVGDASGGLTWHEDEHPPSATVHDNLNNGAAGIGAFLHDLYIATDDVRYLRAAQAVQIRLATIALHDGDLIYWADVDAGVPYARDPSWHWGSAGILEFLTRMAGNR